MMKKDNFTMTFQASLSADQTLGLFISDEYEYTKIIDNKDNGIERKIHNQIQMFNKNNFKIIFYNPHTSGNSILSKVSQRSFLNFLHTWPMQYNAIENIKFIYIRKPFYMDGNLILFLKKLKKYVPDVKILLEIPTFPYDGESKKIINYSMVIKDRFWRKFLKAYINRIVTYSQDQIIWNIKTITICNAVIVKKPVPINPDFYNKQIINCIACSSLLYWHGYDRAIEGLHHYYQKYLALSPPNIIHLYIVGTGSETNKYKKMILDYQLENYVHMCGSLYGEDLEKVYNICTIGLDSMGRHRSGVEYNSSLKGKEYCAHGLLVVSGVKTEFDDLDDYLYYLKVTADDSALDFNNLLEFYFNQVNCKDAALIYKEIRTFAEQNFSFDIAYKKVLNYLREG